MNIDELDTSLSATDAAVMEVRDKAGAPMLDKDGSPITITLLGKDSDAFKKRQNEIDNRRYAAGARMKLTAEALRADAASVLAKCTVSWTGISDECSYDNAVTLYTRVSEVREQVDTFIGDRSNFSKASASS